MARSNDSGLVTLVQQLLMRMLGKAEVRDAVPLAFANKQDLPDTVNAAEITDKLAVHSLPRRNCHKLATCATSTRGLYKGPDWLFNWLWNRK